MIMKGKEMMRKFEEGIEKLKKDYCITMSADEVKAKWFPDGMWVYAVEKYADDDIVLGHISYWLLMNSLNSIKK